MNNSSGATRSQTLILNGFSLFLVLVGLALLVFGVFFVQEGFASRNWDRVEAEVITISVETDFNNSTSSNTRRVDGYYAVVTYAYEYDDDRYINDRFSLGRGPTATRNYDTREEAREAAEDDYPIGSDLDIYVNPDDPESTVIQAGADWTTFVPLILGAFFLPGGLLFLWVGRRARQQPPSDSQMF